jgi:hypothetical protein
MREGGIGGFVVSKEQLRKNGKRHKGKVLSQETKDKISNAKKGKKFSDKHKLALSKAHMGKPSNKKGKALCQETKDKIASSLKGRKNLYKEVTTGFIGSFIDIKHNFPGLNVYLQSKRNKPISCGRYKGLQFTKIN